MISCIPEWSSGFPYFYTVEVRNRFKGLGLIHRVPDELWNEVHDTVQETGIKTIPIEKKCKKTKWLSEEALQIAVKTREASLENPFSFTRSISFSWGQLWSPLPVVLPTL